MLFASESLRIAGLVQFLWLRVGEVQVVASQEGSIWSAVAVLASSVL